VAYEAGKGGSGSPPDLKISGQTLFRANSVQGKSKLLKILNDKKYIFNTVNSGHTLFFRAAQVAQKS